jgi:1,2-phenylacetyl-CoA epoxidase PaaB subunit
LSGLESNQTYEVFTRGKRGDVLTHIGTVDAPNGELAKLYALNIYDEEKWIGMAVVNREHVKWVIEIEGLLGKGRRRVNV